MGEDYHIRETWFSKAPQERKPEKGRSAGFDGHTSSEVGVSLAREGEQHVANAQVVDSMAIEPGHCHYGGCEVVQPIGRSNLLCWSPHLSRRHTSQRWRGYYRNDHLRSIKQDAVHIYMLILPIQIALLAQRATCGNHFHGQVPLPEELLSVTVDYVQLTKDLNSHLNHMRAHAQILCKLDQ
eukprot:449266-Amphidinium_carterae.2